uniref:Uncharacterized protein n=1 Tax=Triticum urartu TaxID=4572 RepID=A0A8R7NXT3_TRIUA
KGCKSTCQPPIIRRKSKKALSKVEGYLFRKASDNARHMVTVHPQFLTS